MELTHAEDLVLQRTIKGKLQKLLDVEFEGFELMSENINGYFQCMLDLGIISEETYVHNMNEMVKLYASKTKERAMLQRIDDLFDLLKED